MKEDKTQRILPSIRSRVVGVFILFGSVLCILLMLMLAISPGWQAGIFSLLLIFLLMVTSGGHIGSYMTRDVRLLSRRMTEVTKQGLSGGEQALSTLDPSTQETHDLVEAFSRYAREVDRLHQDLQYQVTACEQKVDDATFILSNFMYNIAHTLRTPLNAIRWTVETLKNEEPGNITEPQRELLDKLEYSSVNLLRVADELQDTLIVIRNEPLRMRRRACALQPVIDEVAGERAVAARRNHVTLKWKPPPEPVPNVVCDPDRIHQAVQILVDNAIRYTRPGRSVEVSVHLVGDKPPIRQARSLHLPPDVRRAVVVCVRDEGMGIPVEEQAHIFKPFYRGSNARDAWVDGRGIGLTLSRAIVQQLGGQIWFVSRVGYGTTMCFSIPAVF